MKVAAMLFLAGALADASISKTIPTILGNTEEKTADLGISLDIAVQENDNPDDDSVLDIGQIHEDRKTKHTEKCNGKACLKKRLKKCLKGKTESGFSGGTYGGGPCKSQDQCKGDFEWCGRGLCQCSYGTRLIKGRCLPQICGTSELLSTLGFGCTAPDIMKCNVLNQQDELHMLQCLTAAARCTLWLNLHTSKVCGPQGNKGNYRREANVRSISESAVTRTINEECSDSSEDCDAIEKAGLCDNDQINHLCKVSCGLCEFE